MGQAQALAHLALTGLHVKASAIVVQLQVQARSVMPQVQHHMPGLRVLFDIAQRLLQHPKYGGGHGIRQLGQHVYPRIHRDTGALAEFAGDLGHGTGQAHVVQQRGAQIVRDAAHVSHHALHQLQPAAQRGRGIRLTTLQLHQGGLEDKLHRHQPLADAVVQLARDAGALCLLRQHHLLGHGAQTGIGRALLKKIQGKSASRDQQHCGERYQKYLVAGLYDGCRGRAGDQCLGFLQVVQVQAGAHHPAPGGDELHIAQLALDAVGRGPVPRIVHKAAAALGPGHQLLDGQAAGRTAQLPLAAALQLRLAGVHQAVAVLVVDEEIAIFVKVHAPQQRQGFVLGGSHIAPISLALHQISNGAQAHAHKMRQLVLASLQQNGLHRRNLGLRQLVGLLAHRPHHCRHRQQQRHCSQQQHFPP